MPARLIVRRPAAPQIGPQSLDPGEQLLGLVRQIHPAHPLRRILGAVEELGILLAADGRPGGRR
jgi:hypothetical protein